MRMCRSFVPSRLTALEDRIALSTTAVSPSIVRAMAPHLVDLHGSVNGHESLRRGSSQISLSGAGNMAPLGDVQLKGALREIGADPTQFRATITLRDAMGTLRVALQGSQAGPLQTSDVIELSYTILGGTGRDRGATGVGRASLREIAPPIETLRRVAPLFSLTFGPDSMPVDALLLDGVIQGSYLKDNDAGATASPYMLQNATGYVAPLGTTAGVGFLAIQNGEPSIAEGSLTLSNGDGTLALRLNSVQGGQGTLKNLTYSVVGGTGAFVGVTGGGTVQIEFGGPVLILDPGPGHPQGGRQGSFALAFGNATPPPLPPA
jgi:hypothetical protein